MFCGQMKRTWYLNLKDARWCWRLYPERLTVYDVSEEGFQTCLLHGILGTQGYSRYDHYSVQWLKIHLTLSNTPAGIWHHTDSNYNHPHAVVHRRVYCVYPCVKCSYNNNCIVYWARFIIIIIRWNVFHWRACTSYDVVRYILSCLAQKVLHRSSWQHLIWM